MANVTRVGRVLVPVSDQDEAIYVVSPRDAERWPRVDPVRLCA